MDKTRVVVITGGSSGIGKGMAEAFAANGDAVVIIGRREEALRDVAQSIGAHCSWQRADVSQSAQVSQAIHAIVERAGKIDVLINNAGYSGFEQNITQDTPLEQAEAGWNEVIAINLTGTFLMTQAVFPHMTSPGGRIINISSDAAFTGAIGLRLAGYAAAKAGLLGLTHSLALEYGPKGITVNVIAPGFISGSGANDKVPAEIVSRTAQGLPVRRVGTVRDVAAAALYLASPEAGFVTGEVLNLNGGRVFGR